MATEFRKQGGSNDSLLYHYTMSISSLELLLRPSCSPLTPSKCSLVVCDWESAFLQRTLHSAGRWVSLNGYSTLLVPSLEIKNGSNCLIGSLPDFSSWPPQFSVNVARADLFSFGFHPVSLQSGCCTNCSKRAPFSLLLSLLSSPTSPSYLLFIYNCRSFKTWS